MPRDQLHRTLDELQRQLESTADIDEGAREHLRLAMHDIRRALAAPAPDVEPNPGLVERLREAVTHFEGEHPVLTTSLADLIATLRRAGF